MYMKIKKYPWKNKIVVCNRTPYPVEDFVYLCITFGSATSLANHLNCARTTVNSSIQKYFPELGKSGSNLRTKFLDLLDLKYCPQCSSFLEKESFWKNKSRPDGLNTYCKSCQKNKEESRERDHKKEYEKRSTYYKEKAARRRAKKLERTPKWADLDKIKQIYDECPPGFHVDHIIPLQGKLVSGLHTPENLQYLSKEENLAKGNSFTP
jgi:hypothetical protein